MKIEEGRPNPFYIHYTICLILFLYYLVLGCLKIFITPYYFLIKKVSFYFIKKVYFIYFGMWRHENDENRRRETKSLFYPLHYPSHFFSLLFSFGMYQNVYYYFLLKRFILFESLKKCRDFHSDLIID